MTGRTYWCNGQGLHLAIAECVHLLIQFAAGEGGDWQRWGQTKKKEGPFGGKKKHASVPFLAHPWLRFVKRNCRDHRAQNVDLSI